MGVLQTGFAIFSIALWVEIVASQYTILILGNTKEASYKTSLLQKLAPAFDVSFLEEDKGTLVILRPGDFDREPRYRSDYVTETKVANSTLTVIFATKGTAEMSLEELGLLRETIFDTNVGLAAIEIGAEALQTTTILEHSSFCWGVSRLAIDAPNRVFLCNEIRTTLLPFGLASDIRTLSGDQRVSQPTVATLERSTLVATSSENLERSLWPSMLVSAAEIVEQKEEDEEKEEKGKEAAKEESVSGKKTYAKKRTAQPSKRKAQREVQTRSSRQLPEEKKSPADMLSRAEKLTCRYRKSCYETGELPEEIQSDHVPTQPAEIQRRAAEEGVTLEKTQIKLLCKYRPSCYAEMGLEMTEEEHKKHQARVLTTKAAPPPPTAARKPKSLKEIADKTMRQAEERQHRIEQHPEKKISPAKLKLSDKELKLRHKNLCKYRKSCYESGVLPEVERSAGWMPNVWFFTTTSQTPSKEMPESEKDKKVFCKYRKSCYDTGVIPETPRQQQIVEKKAEKQRKLTSLECKYRKSCYETGKQAVLDKSHETEVKPPSHVPTSANELRLYCKYRKSCYQRVASEDSSAKLARPGNDTEAASESMHVPVRPPTSNPSHHGEKPAKKAGDGMLLHKEKAPKSAEKTQKASKKTPQPKSAEPTLKKGGAKKLGCKYRKSCYENGQPPKVASGSLLGTIGSLFGSGGEEKPVVKRGKVDVKYDCKYRKSCYDQNKAPIVKEDPEKNKAPEAVLVAEVVEESVPEEQEEVDVEEPPQGEESVPTMPQEEEPEPEDSGPKPPVIVTKQLRSACKYRQSCYDSVGADDTIPIEELMRIRGETCNKYRLSCREKLGLPKKEKAPIGPNGKKLCRKRKTQESQE